MPIQINRIRGPGLPPPLNRASHPIHTPPILARRRLSVFQKLPDSGAAHEDGGRRDVHFGLEAAEEDVPPDVGRRSGFVPGARDAGGEGERGGREVGED